MKTTLAHGLLIPALTLGTMTFGTPVGAADAVRIVRHAADIGMNHIDTANMYEGYARAPGSAGGVAEEIIGEAVRGARSRYLISTKVGMKVGPGPLDDMTSPEAIREQLTRSLKRMRTDYVDIYYVHRFDPDTAPEAIAEEMGREMKAGRVRAWGVSNYTAAQLAALYDAAQRVGAPTPGFCQPPLSLLRRDAEAELLPACAKLGVAVIPYQVLQGGLLTGKYRRSEAPPAGSRAAEKPDWVQEMDGPLFDTLEVIETDAKARGLSMPQYAVKWALGRPGVVSAILGAKRPEQLDEFLKATE